MTIVWQSNWLIMLQCLRRAFLFGAGMEVVAAALRFTGVIKTLPGFMLVLYSLIDTSWSYAVRRDRIDGLPGAMVGGIVLAVFFGAVTWVVLAAQGRAVPSFPCGAAVFSLALSWSIMAARRLGRGRYD
jgi:hypothetical protein